MKVTVCEFAKSPNDDDAAWEALAAHTRTEKSELVLLPEMPFYRWLAATNEVDQLAWEAAVAAHERWLGRLPQLGAAVVVSSRPLVNDGKNLNEGYTWDKAAGYHGVHHKYYLPDEEAYWEATWYERGGGQDFDVVQTASGLMGFLICTEIWFNHHGRHYAKEGIELLVCPRATPTSTTARAAPRPSTSSTAAWVATPRATTTPWWPRPAPFLPTRAVWSPINR